ncbi:MAG: hypothetical protein AAF487_07610 [Bacteroidota bacterium]
MKKTLALALVFLFVVACEKFSRPDVGPEISGHNKSESHNKGLNCMTCHYSEGQAVEGIYSLAGSAFGNTQNADVELYASSSASEPFHIIEIDQFGNFYTTEPIEFGDGLFVAVRAENGDISFMQDPIMNGQCNLCHGTNVEERIVID